MKMRNVTLSAAGCLLVLATVPALGQVSDDAREKMTEAVPATARVVAKQRRKLLVFTLCRGFRHGSVPFAAEALKIMGEKTGAYETVVSDDPAMFDPENLNQFDAVCMDNTTGQLFEEQSRKTALLDFVRNGKGIIGIHAATDCFYNWPEYGEMMGGYFSGHPWNENITVKIDDPENPLCAAFAGTPFEVIDEIYQFRQPYSRDALRVILSLDMTKVNNKGQRPDSDYAVSWVRSYGKGRVFYCSLGHRNEIFWNPPVLQHYLDGIQFACGDLEAETTPVPLDPRSVDPYMGEYVGNCTIDGTTGPAEAKVVAQGGGSYLVAVLSPALAGKADGERIELHAGAAGGGILDVYTDAAGTTKGVNFAYYEGDWDKLPDFNALTPVKTGTAPGFDIGVRQRQDNFGLRFTGFVKLEEAGVYSFSTKSDDGSKLSIGDKVVVDNDGLHGAVEKSGNVELEAGLHPITVTFFEKGGGEELTVGVSAVAEEVAEGGLPVSGNALGTKWSGTIANDRLVAEAENGSRIVLRFHERTSPTLGQQPPAGAVVLLPPGEDGAPMLDGWANASWATLPDGSMQVTRGNNQTKQQFGDVRLHLEFMCPYEPQGRGQGRGNSGVYFQSRYEIQVLDSFGLVPGMGDCGAIYGVAIADTNACLPPLRWQTYDVVFRAARLGPAGEIEAPPTFVSVKHNGVTIHENREVKGATRSAGATGHTDVGPLMLQDHSHPVRYRNIWIQELKNR